MQKILCSTGAIFPRTTPDKYDALADIAQKLNCDGFEFLVDSTMYDSISMLTDIIKPMNLYIPVLHCQKSIGESLCGMKAWFDESGYHEYIMTEEEDKASFDNGIERFKKNIEIAKEFNSEKMVLHLWNGTVSDKNISKNIERFGLLYDLSKDAGLRLMVENVVCNVKDPLYNIGLVNRYYPDVAYVYDTKMSEFHGQTMDLFSDEWNYLLKKQLISHLHINDYKGGYMDWNCLKTLPVGAGNVDFDSFFASLKEYNYNGDYTVEATSFNRETGEVYYDILNECFEKIRNLMNQENKTYL